MYTILHVRRLANLFRFYNARVWSSLGGEAGCGRSSVALFLDLDESLDLLASLGVGDAIPTVDDEAFL